MLKLLWPLLQVNSRIPDLKCPTWRHSLNYERVAMPLSTWLWNQVAMKIIPECFASFNPGNVVMETRGTRNLPFTLVNIESLNATTKGRILHHEKNNKWSGFCPMLIRCVYVKYTHRSHGTILFLNNLYFRWHFQPHCMTMVITLLLITSVENYSKKYLYQTK